MSFLTNQLPLLALFTGNETLPVDTNKASGGQPQQNTVEFYKLAMTLVTLLNTLSKTMVDGSIYYSQIEVGFTYDPTPQGSNIAENTYVTTGINIPVGSTGGTDTFHAALYNSAGVLVARTATAGVTAGTALTIQQLPWAGSTGAATGVNAPVTITSGVYYLAIQSNGTTAKFLAINSPIWPKVTGSQTGTAGTLAAITPPSTYTQNLGPMASLY